MSKLSKTTIADIAREAGVSAMTVSRYLSGKGPVAKDTARRIQEIIDRSGYQPNYLARSLSSKKSMVIGVTIPRIEHALMDNYLAQVLSGITDAVLLHDYRVMLFPFNPNEGEANEFVNLFRSKIIDGLVLLKTLHGDERIRLLAKNQLPFVLVNHKYYAPHVHFIDVNNEQGMRLVVEYLVKKGHRKIAFVSGDLRETNARDRLNGFVKAMGQNGLEVRDDWIVYGQFNQQIAYERSACLFSDTERPHAVVCSDDYMAIGVIRRIKEIGLRVPEDVVVTGFDDIEIAAYTRPALTTVRQPIEKIGHLAGKILLNLLRDGIKNPVRRLLKVELIVRESA
ncbi:MAG TPA: LacI family transcriptional regulator [Caldithrix abyssi]|uniref:LacI family transcriptional regulator n=1 Tax=Caldithrix abyssi TaxID=187145 RepID=A0A7V5H338_CALAY|nr:LacI family DNA-binding transcriptional regulator [Caldisericaceae bacterium]HHE54885.1 LacI family transcriptional regulator [Caldithrix abyssi]